MRSSVASYRPPRLRRALFACLLAALAVADAGAQSSVVRPPSKESVVNALTPSVTDSLALWDTASLYGRLGKAGALREIDPLPLLGSLSSRFAKAGRYKEFEYLFEFLGKARAAGKLSVRVVEARPPLPGFWPALLDDGSLAILLSKGDEASLSPTGQLYASSFLRAAAALYYAEAQPAIGLAYRNRNAPAELAAFMSGFLVESIYLREIARVAPGGLGSTGTGATAAGPDETYIGSLLASAAQDNLYGMAQVLFAIRLDLVYEALRVVQASPGAAEAARFAGEAAGLADELAASAEAALARPTRSFLDLELGARARGALLCLPWVAVALLEGPAGRDPASLASLQRLAASLRRLGRAYGPLDIDVMESRRRRLNEQAFVAPDASAPGPLERLAPADGLAAYPGSARAAWFFLCDPMESFLYEGRLPLEPEAALAGAAYRFSYDTEERLVAVEYFVKGSLRDSDCLDWAARVRYGYDGPSLRLDWENASGAPVACAGGYSTLTRTPVPLGRGGSEEYRFYAPDGRRVHHRSEAWSVLARRSETILETVYRDSAGRGLDGTAGYAIARRTRLDDGSYRTQYLGDDGKPARSVFHGCYGLLSRTREEGGSVTWDTGFTDADGRPMRSRLGTVSERRTETLEVGSVERFGSSGGLTDEYLGWGVARTSRSGGLERGIGFWKADGSPASLRGGYASCRYERDEAGNATRTAYFDAEGKPALYEGLFHARLGAYDARGVLVELSFIGVDGAPAADDSGASRIRWTVGEDGENLDVTVWDANGAIMVGAPSPAI